MNPYPNHERPTFKCVICTLPVAPGDCSMCDSCWDARDHFTNRLPNRHLQWCTKCLYEDELILKEIQGRIDENKRVRLEHTAACNVCIELGVNCCPDLDDRATQGDLMLADYDETADVIYSAMYC